MMEINAITPDPLFPETYQSYIPEVEAVERENNILMTILMFTIVVGGIYAAHFLLLQEAKEKEWLKKNKKTR